MNMPNPFEIDPEIDLLEAAANDDKLYQAQLNRMASLPGLAKQTRPAVENTLVAGTKAKKARELTPEQSDLLKTLEYRFSKRPSHYQRPKGIHFEDVKAALEANPTLMGTLLRMERTGGEPDVISVEGDGFIFADCSMKAPSGRKDLTYDQAIAMAATFGVELMFEVEYRFLQRIGSFDTLGSWVWLRTPDNIREDGHALHGYRSGSVTEVGRRGAKHHDDRGSWRGMLRVPKV